MPVCIAWEYLLNDEFNNTALPGWSISLGNGQATVSDSQIHLRDNPGGEYTFPIVWRNDGFRTQGDLVFETRFRYSEQTPYGVTIGVGSRENAGLRYKQTEPPIPGVEDILSIHLYRGEFRIKLLNQIVWSGSPMDEGWHETQMILEGSAYTLWVDGVRVAALTSVKRPLSLYLGNPSIQIFHGPWTSMDVDYVRVSHCVAWGYPTSAQGGLPLLFKTR